MSLLILYGSETGTAQDVGESLRREALMRNLTVRLISMDEYDLHVSKFLITVMVILKFQSLPNEKAALLVCSTTGQGEMPPNMRSFWRSMLRKSIPNDFLTNTHAAVLGLGDSSYQKFNFAGKRLFRRLEQLGARMLTQLGLADDQHEIGIDGALIPWKEAVWMRLYEEKIFENMKLEVDPTTVIPSKFILEPASISENLNFHEEDQEYRLLTAEENRRVTADDHFQDTRLVRFSVDDKDSHFFSYNPGDVLMVWPYNNDESMQIAIDALQYSDDLLDRPVHIRTNDRYLNPPPKWLVGDPTTLRSCLRRLLDLQTIPRRTFFEVFASLAVDEFEKRRLLELASPQGLDDLLAYANRVRRTTAETFRDFPVTSKSISPERLFDLLKTIRPRAFSIASSPVVQGNSIELLVAKVQYKSRLSDPRRGLCSTFLSRLKPGDKVFSKIRPGTFKFPPVEVPLICIGPGTGVAPFRSLLISRERNASSCQSILYFGCRNSKSDDYFREEWEKCRRTKVVKAYSRDQEEKIYVQHRMIEPQNAGEIREWILEKNASIFIAGSSGDMPKAVTGAIHEICQKDVQTEEIAAKLEKEGRLQFETWS
ncbi:hypothetical protein WR25_11607 isoform E [Diploscapter pachys]|uniref:NADPH-dependent diflavin oxidoreductase 1 n=2 Tax=Diploscapter pachys TaxID=2018661 RepID=A0A2A2KRM1_9BILA|nr:hypothetical protein WR25_11607 isoform E [Diploscapter pachys]